MNKVQKFPLSSLYMFTGKGGVGKTEVSRLFYKKIKKENPNRKVYLIQVDTSSDFDAKNNRSFEKQKNDQEIITLHLKECATEYMARKIHSKRIASWISSTNFYKTIVSMLPGLNYLIYFGKILKIIDEEEAIIILDSPSSGHLLAMFQSLDNFKKIFKVGPIYNDICLMLEILNQENYLKLAIVSQLEEIILNETIELQYNLSEYIKVDKILYFINGLYSQIPNLNKSDLPNYLVEKISSEENLLNQMKENKIFKNNILPIPYITELEDYQLGEFNAL
ncbi:hypothetical protein N9N67_03390 [Bacteriovoracaceae bacterium]|nr:hypothetical protein [Bacteriovoracaceae bacterium]